MKLIKLKFYISLVILNLVAHVIYSWSLLNSSIKYIITNIKINISLIISCIYNFLIVSYVLIFIRIRMLGILSNTDVESDREKWGKTNSDIFTLVPHYNRIRIQIFILSADTDTDAKNFWITISTFPLLMDTTTPVLHSPHSTRCPSPVAPRGAPGRRPPR